MILGSRCPGRGCRRWDQHRFTPHPELKPNLRLGTASQPGRSGTGTRVKLKPGLAQEVARRDVRAFGLFIWDVTRRPRRRGATYRAFPGEQHRRNGDYCESKDAHVSPPGLNPNDRYVRGYGCPKMLVHATNKKYVGIMVVLAATTGKG